MNGKSLFSKFKQTFQLYWVLLLTGINLKEVHATDNLCEMLKQVNRNQAMALQEWDAYAAQEIQRLCKDKDMELIKKGQKVAAQAVEIEALVSRNLELLAEIAQLKDKLVDKGEAVAPEPVCHDTGITDYQ